MDFYQSISNYYDYIFPYDVATINFITSFISKSQSKALLNIGCGTGILDIELAKKGFVVKAIDYDTDMIKIANDKIKDIILQNKPKFIQLDMKTIKNEFTNQSFDIITCFGNTLVHLLDKNDIKEFLASVKSLLKQGGIFLLQIINYNYILNNNIKNLPLIDNDIITFERFYDYQKEKHLINFKTILTIKKTGQKIENEIYLYPLVKEELEEYLQIAGFSTLNFYGNFSKNSLEKNSLPLIVKCE
ncbi:MAG: hypothetical protein A2086_03180 [Spirochaetes bacterium GWD1_27_9]|nr:MAG: hypothetical protein A2Y34_14180 [Spirochaetes bacterium GWC1_27_15]OHD38700.1 MAG: hypothetical protein A2086_03180 [Spirochaetes bacterium GWD1_27_9]